MHLVIANMHIVCSKNPPSITTRQRAVKLLREHLETFKSPNQGVPVVRIIVGDNSLKTQQVQEALQREKNPDPVWKVFAALADGPGDHVAVSGATARFQPIAVGKSFEDRGVRNDQHDAVAIVLTLAHTAEPPTTIQNLTLENTTPTPQPTKFREASQLAATLPPPQRVQEDDPLAFIPKPHPAQLPDTATTNNASSSTQPADLEQIRELETLDDNVMALDDIKSESHTEEKTDSRKRKSCDDDDANSEFSPDWSSDHETLISKEAEEQASMVHTEMRHFWDERYEIPYDPALFHHLRTLLFMKRKSHTDTTGYATGASQPGNMNDIDEEMTAYASEEETYRAIREVLQHRQTFLVINNIADMHHILTSDERADIVKTLRHTYEESREQIILQDRDVEKGLAKGLQGERIQKGFDKGGKGHTKGNMNITHQVATTLLPRETHKGKKYAGGAAQPTGKGKHVTFKTKGKSSADGATRPAPKGSLANFLRQQRRKRWCRHLQRVCGTKQMWEVLTFTGRFDVDMLRQAIQSDHTANTEPPAEDSEEKQRRRSLHHAKAEAKAKYNEGRRLAMQRSRTQLQASEESPAKHPMNRDDGAPQPANTAYFSRRQYAVLQMWDDGQLRKNLNKTITDLGHGRLQSAQGAFLEIGGSTGGGARRIIDSWVPPDWHQFLEEDEH